MTFPVQAIKNINNPPVFFFCKIPDLTVLNKAINYVRKNEMTENLRIVHIHGTDESENVLQQLQQMIALFDHIHPKLRLDLISVVGTFDPAMVEWISIKYSVPRNMMFIKQPGNKNVHKVSACGVRVITG